MLQIDENFREFKNRCKFREHGSYPIQILNEDGAITFGCRKGTICTYPYCLNSIGWVKCLKTRCPRIRREE